MRWPILLFCIGAFAPAARGQELNERDQAFMKEFKAQLELADVRAMNKLVQRDADIAREVIDTYCMAFAKEKDADPKFFDPIRPLAARIDDVEGGKRVTKRLEFLAGQKDDGRKVWVDLCERANGALTLFEEARTRKEPPTWKKAAAALEEVVQMGVKLGDLEQASNCRYFLGLCHDGLSDYEAEFSDFDKAMDEWLASGRAKDATYTYMTGKRAELQSQGYDPAQRPGDKGAGGAAPSGAAKKNSSTSYKEGSQWQEWTTEYKEMQAPEQFGTTSPLNSDFILLWREFGFADKGVHPLGVVTQAVPFGKALSVVREGAHAFLRQGEDKKSDVPVKILDNKPSLASLTSEEKDKERYAVFLTTGGQNATWFGANTNYQQRGCYRSGFYREGKVLGETVVLLDDNASGVLGDPLATKDNFLACGPDWVDDDTIIVGKRVMAWSDVLPIGTKWYQLQLVDAHAKQIRTRELDIETGQVVLKWSGPVAPRVLVLAETRDFKGSYFDVAGGKPVAVPVGRYEIAWGVIETGKGPQLKQAWIFKGDAKEFEVGAKATVTLDMGGPYKLDFDRKLDPKSIKIVGKSLVAKEKSGAIVGRVYDEVFYPEVWTRPEGTGNGSPGKPMGKPDPKIKQDSTAAWFPGDYVIDKGKEQKLQVQLKLAKHGLLGGPFTSDWK
jgi:hypothetical protein